MVLLRAARDGFSLLFFSFLRNLREREAFGGRFQPSSACLSEKKEIRMQQNVDLARAVLLPQRFSRGRRDPRSAASSFEIIVVRRTEIALFADVRTS